MNIVHPKKLLHSKWTAVSPINKQKHFIVTETEYDEHQVCCRCVLQSIMNKRDEAIDWRELQDSQKWRQGWQ